MINYYRTGDGIDMYYKEEIEITEDDRIIIEKLCELLAQSKIDSYFYTHDQDFYLQLKVFRDEFNEAYDKGFSRYFISKNFYRWVTNNTVYKFTALLEALFKGLLEKFKDVNEDGVLTYKNCRCYRSYNVVTQSEEMAETTQEVNYRILQPEEVKLYENGMLQIEDNVVQTLECFHIKVEQQQEKVDSKKKKELIEQLRTLIYQRMCILLESNLKRANCVEVIQYRLILGILIAVIDKGFKPRFKKEVYESYEVARGVTVTMRSEFDYFKGVYSEFRHGNRNLIRL